MANQERGELGVEVEGTRYTLRPDFNALCELEDLLGKTFTETALEMSNGRPNSGLRSVIWCLLQDKHGAEIKTLKDAGQWIVRAGGAEKVMAMVDELFTLVAGGEESKPATANPQ
jgi:hypothetical protein